LADDIELGLSGAGSCRAADPAPRCPTGKGTAVNPWQGRSSGKQPSKHQGKGNVRAACWGAQRGEQPLGVRGVVQLGFSLGKLQQDTACSVSWKYERDFAQRCERGAMFATSPGNLGNLSAVLVQQHKEGPE